MGKLEKYSTYSSFGNFEMATFSMQLLTLLNQKAIVSYSQSRICNIYLCAYGEFSKSLHTDTCLCLMPPSKAVSTVNLGH